MHRKKTQSHKKRSTHHHRRKHRGGTMLTDLAVPAFLLWASKTAGKGKTFKAFKPPYYGYNKNRSTRRN